MLLMNYKTKEPSKRMALLFTDLRIALRSYGRFDRTARRSA